MRTVVANWKMNFTLPEAIAAAQAITRKSEDYSGLRVVIAPSLPWILPIKEAIRFWPKHTHLASQVVSDKPEGAYTGDVSAKQLKKMVTYCLVGHSERRRYHHETGAVIAHQITQLLDHGITPIVCFGEMKQSKQATFSAQITVDLRHDLTGLSNHAISQCLFAYEPLWAIGTGNPATPEYVARAVKHVKTWAHETYKVHIPVLYGGSVTEDNAAALGQIRELDGLLVGGASLHVKSFDQICRDFCPHV